MEFDGINHLIKRPLDVYFDIFEKQGIKYERGENYLPLKTEGSIQSGEFNIPGDISSQFITGLLFALPLLGGDSTINIIGKLESKAYIDLTLDILKLFNIEILNIDYKRFVIKGNQKYLAHNYTIEGDYSQAAFFLVMGALGNDVSLRCMNLNSLQGDRKIIRDIQDLNGQITYENGLLKASGYDLKGNVIDFAQSPDLGPVLSVLASVTEGNTKFINAQRLRIKECDRITCMRIELEKLGAMVSESESEMYFTGVKGFKGSLDLDCHNDHRVAMSLAVASTVCQGNLLLRGAECVKKSYPHFWGDFKKLGGDFDVID
jgi:3-phosphoshikimate 1-carboxyvinyltransferase